MVSIVIRTKNEAGWLKRCLVGVREQDYARYEVVVVDNESSDDTVRVARAFGCRVVHISDRDYRHGHALNLGVRRARGDLVAILSGHCIPVHERWLSALAAHFDAPDVAGVYGRQVPLPDSDDFDKRDLWTTFGIERREQRIEPFFHNANSMIRRATWHRFPFDSEISGVEDRDWARKVLADGHRIVYEPLATVHHFHGIHQGRDAQRAARVVRVIEVLNGTRRARAAHGGIARKARR